MKIRSSISQASLDNLLGWLSADREDAGAKYLEIREGLIRYFRAKGCFETQSLADETIDRVAGKIGTIDTSGSLKPITYFYGFAKNIFLEYVASLKKTPGQLEPLMTERRGSLETTEENEPRFLCLEECMAKLKATESTMMLDYYAHDKAKKLEARRGLATGLDITMGNLHIRVHRIKQALRTCMEKCLETA